MLKVGTGTIVSALVVGVVKLEFGNKFLVLNNVYYIPSFWGNLISIFRLFEQLFHVSFNNNRVIISKKVWIFVLQS